jgi:four helix bundle protein
MSSKKAGEMEDRLLDFGVRVGAVVDALPESRLGRHIAGQLVRCGTSPAPNYGEADAAESKNDFIHKLGIVFKELRESRIWIKLIIKARLLPTQRMAALFDECEQLCSIIASSLITAKKNRTR